jgi:hypothetical protein
MIKSVINAGFKAHSFRKTLLKLREKLQFDNSVDNITACRRRWMYHVHRIGEDGQLR